MIPQGKSLRFVLPALGAVVAFALLSAAGAHSLLSAEGKSTATDAAAAARVERSYAKLPVSFEPNRGQTDPRVRFLARGNGYGLFLTQDEAVLSLRGKGSAATAVRMRALGANPKPELVGERQLPGRANYLRGRDPHGWQTGLPTYAAVRYRDLYPGIDQVFYGTQGRLEYDFVVAPAADPGTIGLTFSGAKTLSLGRRGELLLEVAGGTLRQPRPFVYQEWGGKRRAVAARYVLDGDRVAFALGRYDRSRQLVIDPKIDYSTYLGGRHSHSPSGIAVDADGSAYVTGSVLGTADFPTTTGGSADFPIRIGGAEPRDTDVFVTKLDETGSAIEYSTYIGGVGADEGTDIAVDDHGRAYVVGATRSSDFPTTPGAFEPIDPDPGPPDDVGTMDAFVAKLGRDGTYLKYSTYLGGRGRDRGAGIAVDVDERAYVTGVTESPDFPTTSGAHQATAAGADRGPTHDAFVTKLSHEGTYLKYSTYLGGSSSDYGADVAVDESRRAYVMGTTGSADFPTTSGAFQRVFGGWSDVFVTKLSSEGTSLKYSTYIGGNRNDDGYGIALDTDRSAYVTGETRSRNFPTTPDVFQPVEPDPAGDSAGDSSNGFVAKLSSEGTSLKYSTYLGGSRLDRGHRIAVGVDGRAYVTGATWSDDFPVTPEAPHPDLVRSAQSDGFVANLSSSGTSLEFSTYLHLGPGPGGAGEAIAVGKDGAFYVAGRTWSGEFPTSDDLPTTPGAVQPARGGWGVNGFVTKFGN